jgi:hypothetical protein
MRQKISIPMQLFGSPWRLGEDNIKKYVKEVVPEGVNWIQVVPDKVHWRFHRVMTF